MSVSVVPAGATHVAVPPPAPSSVKVGVAPNAGRPATLVSELSDVAVSVVADVSDRAQVQAAQSASDFNRQSLDSEQKKYRLGASTTASVLLQQRNLSNAENNLITARATYAKDRAALSQILANTLDRYGISIQDAVTGNVRQVPVIPGLEPAKSQPDVQVPGQQEQLQKQEQAPPPATPAMPQQPAAHPEQTPPPPPQ